MIRKALIIVTVIAGIVGWKIWSDTLSDPVIERLTITTDQLARGEGPVTIALIADIHMAGPDMLPERVERIVAQVNALDTDIIAVAGDLVSEKRTGTKIYKPSQVIAPLGRLKARQGVLVVPGNHDHWYGWPALATELAKYPHITVLENQPAQIGPIAIGGIDDAFTDHDDVSGTIEQMEGLSGPRVILTHSPDVFPDLPADITLVLAGHTHCGQIAYPWGGSPATMSDYGDKYACGVFENAGITLVTSAGLGTSVLPLRFFTRPEIWLITIQPNARVVPSL